MLWCSVLQLVPVGVGELGGPLLDVAEPAVVVAVRGLLDLGVVPDAGVGVVGPGVHLGDREEVVGVRIAAEGAVDDRAGLGAGDGRIGAEDVPAVALDEAELRRDGDVVG